MKLCLDLGVGGARGKRLSPADEVRELACGAPSGPVNPARLRLATAVAECATSASELGWLLSFQGHLDLWIMSQMKLVGCGCPPSMLVQLCFAKAEM